MQSTDLILKAKEPFRDLILKCYVDASHLTHPDSKYRQGYCQSFKDIGSFYIKSSKPQLVSTTVALRKAKSVHCRRHNRRAV